MSKLLERAIIDAQALKEAALKNAEQAVIEKYSQEVKSTMNRILEQEDLGDLGGFDTGDDLGLEEPGGEMEDTGDDPGGLGDEADPTVGAEGAEEQEGEKLDPESIIGGLPNSFDADDDEIVSIKLDSLEADMEEEEEGPFGGDDELEDDELGIDILDNDFELEDEEDDLDLDTETEVDFDAGPDGQVGVDITNDMVQEVLSEMGIDENDIEIDIDELAEAVRVDFEPQKSGWAGTPESIMREYESMLLAREQDSEVKEKNAELRKAVKALKQENKTLVSATRKLQMRTEKYETAFNTLQEKLETMNVSNAKLLYINQALENASLNERQKRKIVEAISKAETVQEAKIVFDTMSDTVGSISDVKRDSTLNEVVSRKSSLLVAARNEQPKKDANPLYSRMQRLAGIKTQKS